MIATILAGDHRSRNYHVVAHATEQQVREAICRVSRSLNRSEPLSHRRTKDVATAVRYLADFPEAHRGNIVGLAEKAIRWHRADRQRELQRQVRAELGAETPMVRPPVPLPDLPGIRFLGTVGEVADEGREMNHCIAAYAAKARDGLSYLFHADFEGDAASIEVSPRGFIAQAQGPHNSKNKATDYGVRQLSAWADRFRVDR